MNFLSGKARALSDSPSPKRFKVPDIPVRKAIELGTGWVFRPLQYQSQEYNVLLLVYTRVQEDHGRDSPSAMCHQVEHAIRWKPTLWQVMWKDWRPDYTGISRDRTALLPKTDRSDLTLKISTASLNFKIMTRAVVTFIWVAIPYRSVWALGNRGYRSVLIEAGHTCQNLILAAAGLGYEVFPTDMFHDELVMKMANLDHETQWPVYIAAVGKIDQDWKL